MLGAWIWEQGPDVRTSPIIPCWRACEARQGTIMIEPLPPAPKTADDRHRVRRHGIDQLTVSWCAIKRGCRRAGRPRCAWQATIRILLEVTGDGWMWRGALSLGQVRGPAYIRGASSQPQRDIGQGVGRARARRLGGPGVEGGARVYLWVGEFVLLLSTMGSTV